MEIPAAGGIVFDPDGRILLIRRGRPPGAGLWSIPGGKCEPGESAEAACVRELAEETGLLVRVVEFAGRVVRPAPDGDLFVIDDFVCALSETGAQLSATPRAGDDADGVGWFSAVDLASLPLIAGLADALTEWGLLPT